MKYVSLIFGCFLCISCTQQPAVIDAEVGHGNHISDEIVTVDSTQLDVVTAISFEEYVNQIPILPIGYSSENGFGIVKIENNSYTPESAQVIGRMKSIQNTHFIIYSYPADVALPMLEVYNVFGKKLHELPLIELKIEADIDPLNNGTSDFTIISETAIELKNVYKHTEYNASAEIDTVHLEELIDY